MINLEHKLTVDDLIVEYMMYKVKNGYEACFLISEFMDFLFYFEGRMAVYDSLYDGLELFKRFFDRKYKNDWYSIKNWNTMEKEKSPHMEMKYSSQDGEYLIKANYRLSDYDKSCLNTYFMDNGMGKFDNFKGKTFEIRNIIGEYLSSQSKRKIDESLEIDEKDLLVSKYVSAHIITNIWNSYIDKLVQRHQWPSQCRDINKYLFDMDLSEIIGVKSIKKELIELYNVFSKRIAILYHQDGNLKISSYYNSYLARSNYELLIDGYKDMMSIAFGEYKKSLEIDLSTLTFKESHEMDGVYDFDEEPDVKTTVSNVENSDVKKLVKSLDEMKSII